MLKRLLVFLLVIAVALVVATAAGAFDAKDPHVVDHIGGGSSVGPASPMENVVFMRGDNDRRTVDKLRLHKRIGDRSRPAGFVAERGSSDPWCKTFHVWVTGDNGITGQMQVRGDASGKWCYDLADNSVLSLSYDSWCNVGPIVWDCISPVPWDTVAGHGWHSGPRWEYRYRRIYFKFKGDWFFLGIPVTQTVIPYVNLTARGNGDIVLGRGGI